MNFILLLGWSPEGEQEIFTLEEAVQILILKDYQISVDI